jgi:hypothetical protein
MTGVMLHAMSSISLFDGLAATNIDGLPAPASASRLL